MIAEKEKMKMIDQVGVMPKTSIHMIYQSTIAVLAF
jgi:hypothetical protein